MADWVKWDRQPLRGREAEMGPMSLMHVADPDPSSPLGYTKTWCGAAVNQDSEVAGVTTLCDDTIIIYLYDFCGHCLKKAWQRGDIRRHQFEYGEVPGWLGTPRT